MLERNFRLLRLFNFCTDFRLLAPIAIIYYSEVAGSYALGASVFSIVMVSSAVLDVPTGVYSDQLGRKRCMAIGAACAMAYAVCYASASGFWLLALGAVFEGASRAFYSGSDSALLYESLATEGREREYPGYAGRAAAMFQLALGSSALLGGVVATWSLSAVVWLSVIPQVGCLLIALQLREPPRREEAEPKAPLAHLGAALAQFVRNPRVRLLTSANVLGHALGETGYQFQAAFYAMLWPVWAIGAAKTISGVLAAASFHFAGPLIDRFGPVTAMLAQNVYSKVVGFAALLFPSPLSPLLMTSSSAFFGVGSVAKGALLQAEFTDDQRATMSSLNSFAASLLFAVVAFLAGLAADSIGPTQMLLALQVIGLITLALNVWFAMTVRQTRAAPAT
jgi:predicted MFS family arabinose efflux permease